MAPRKKAKPTHVSATPPDPSPPPIPIWKRPWVWFSGFVTALALVLASVISILSDARALPGEWQKTSDQFFEWYGEYPAWKGHWTSNPEGYVDVAEMNLSTEDFRINIDETDGGRIAGTIETKSICEKTPIFEYLLVDGSISSSGRAEIEVFDFIGGYRINFAKLALRRDGYMMTVAPINDPAGLFSKEIHIALYPNEFRLDGSAEADADDDREPICGGKRAKFFTDVVHGAQPQNAARPPK